eukprot:6301463-Amphidinium_carterae.3
MLLELGASTVGHLLRQVAAGGTRHGSRGVCNIRLPRTFGKGTCSCCLPIRPPQYLLFMYDSCRASNTVSLQPGEAEAELRRKSEEIMAVAHQIQSVAAQVYAHAHRRPCAHQSRFIRRVCPRPQDQAV